MSSSNGANMELCGTPKIISDREQYVSFSFTLCLCLVKYEAISLNNWYLPHKNEV